MTTQTIVEPRLTEIAAAINGRLKRQWQDVLAIGRLALEAKELLPRGTFVGWVENNLQLSIRLIQGYMRFYERLAAHENFVRLPISAGLLLASPSVPDGVLVEVERRLAAGGTLTVEAVEGVIDQFRVLEGVHLGTKVVLKEYGTNPDGSPAKQISRSAMTSLEAVSGQAVNRGAVEVEGQHVSAVVPLPEPIRAAVEYETERRQREHIGDEPFETVVYQQEATVAAFVTNDLVTLKIPGIGNRLGMKEQVIVTIKRRVDS